MTPTASPSTASPGTDLPPATQGDPSGRSMQAILWGRRARLLAARLLCVLALAGVWQYLVVSDALTPDAVATPTQIGQALGSLMTTAEFWTPLGDTVRTWAIGLALSVLIALPVGVLFGASETAYRLSRVTVDFLRTIPPVALLPLALLLYGASARMALVLVVFGSVWPLLLQTMYGVHQIDPVTAEVARAYRLTRGQRLKVVLMPSAAPFIATGIRIAATISLLLAIGAELLGGTAGLGNAISQAQQAQDMPTMYAFVVASAFLGVALNLMMARAERRVLSWHPAHRDH
ncbi:MULTISPECIES: ABC transporter permease [unclassified Streptomyces]|uniref:ABC transporter permease n=1 Tax=unclassified Streptomyces TaxID=2593676 RepID=UPI0035D685D2